MEACVTPVVQAEGCPTTRLTEEELHILQHSLGVDRHGCGNQYRNRYVVGPGQTGYQTCMRLTALGFMKRTACAPELTGGCDLFEVTPLGQLAVFEQSSPAPKLKPGQLRYRMWLRAREYASMSFIEFCRHYTAASKTDLL